MEKISVLMSLYYKESPAFFDKALESVFNQTYAPSEVVIVIDGPICEALETVLQSYKRKYIEIIKIIRLEKNVGLGNALNVGLSHCDNELIARVDTDDINVSSRFQKQVDYMKSNPDVDILGSWVEEFSYEINDMKIIRTVPTNVEKIKIFSKYRNPLNHMSVIFKKSQILKVGGYEDCPLHEDYYLWVKMLKHEMKIINFPETLVHARTNGSDMYKRRGGISYLKSEIYFQKMAYKLGYLNLLQVLKNILVKSIIILLPSNLRALIYQVFLRGRHRNAEL